MAHTEEKSTARSAVIAKVPEGARRAGQAIERHLLLLESASEIGRPFPETPELRGRIIAFADSG